MQVAQGTCHIQHLRAGESGRGGEATREQHRARVPHQSNSLCPGHGGRPTADEVGSCSHFHGFRDEPQGARTMAHTEVQHYIRALQTAGGSGGGSSRLDKSSTNLRLYT